MKNTILLTLLMLAAAFAFSACQHEPSAKPENYFYAPVRGYSLEPFVYNSLEILLADMAMAKFDEANRFQTEWIYWDLRNLRELYMPRKVPEGFELIAIWSYSFSGRDRPFPIVFQYYPGYISFAWHREITTIEVGFWINFEGDGARKAQHGYEFRLEFPTSFTEQEVYDFGYAEPIVTWELQGNAVSLVAQRVGNISIFDEDGYEIVIEPTNVPIGSSSLIRPNVELHTLYSIDGVRVGYRWRFGAGWQYVLKPSTYTFRVDGAVRTEPTLLVRHFDDHEIVSSADYGEELAGQDFTSFTITVTPTGSYLTINE